MRHVPAHDHQLRITRVVNRIGDDGIEIIDVQNWIVNDESIQPKAEAE